jgi:hypothetical protein
MVHLFLVLFAASSVTFLSYFEFMIFRELRRAAKQRRNAVRPVPLLPKACRLLQFHALGAPPHEDSARSRKSW